MLECAIIGQYELWEGGRYVNWLKKGLVKCLKWSAMLILGVITIIVSINLYVLLTARPRTMTVEQLAISEFVKDNPPVLILGAGIYPDQTPSNILAKRLNEALSIYRRLPNLPLIASGDHMEDNYNEVRVMKNYLVQQGVPSQQVYLDHAGYSTYESLYRLKHVLHQQKAVIVTQGYHLPRALMIARSLGIDAVGVPAGETSSTRLKREVREVGARLKDFAVTHIGYHHVTPEDNYAFSLQENGDLTNDKGRLSK